MLNISIHDRVALLIDADNAQLKHIKQVVELSKYYGHLEICEAFGDWELPPLTSWRENVEVFGIQCVQVNRDVKNDTDHYLMMQAGELLGNSLSGPDVNIFVIVSGDGDFKVVCDYIRERGRRVIGIGNREHSSQRLYDICDEFLYLEDLGKKLKEIRQHRPIHPDEVRAFYNFLFYAYERLIGDRDWVWVSYSQLGKKLREMVPDYEKKFGKYKLSEWLSNFEKYYENCDQMVRRIHPNPELMRWEYLGLAYFQTGQGGPVHLAQFGTALREVSRSYDDLFGSKTLSEWIEEYPDTFRIRDDHVIHRNHWEDTA